MPEPLTSLERRSPPERENYRPVSGLALTALGVSALFATAVTVVGGTAFYQGKIFFVGLWILIFPMIGLVLAITARRQILGTESTRSGAALAGTAWWLSVLFGLGYGAYYFATYLAVRQQASTFADGWLKKLQDGKTIEAFLQTVDPAQRKFDKAADASGVFERYGLIPISRGGTPSLVNFENNDVVHLVREGAAATHITPLGVRNWDRDELGFSVIMTYAVTVPTCSFDLQIAMRGIESKDFEGRQWRIALGQTVLSNYEVSLFGQTADAWRKWARVFAVDFISKLHNQDLTGAFVDTLEQSRRPAALRQFLVRCFAEELLNIAALQSSIPAVGPGAGLVVPLYQFAPELLRRRHLAGYERFVNGDLIRSDQLMVRDVHRTEISSQAKRCFQRPDLFSFKLASTRSVMTPIGPDADHMDLAEEMEMNMYPEGTEQKQPIFMATAALLLQSEKGELTGARAPKFFVTGVRLVRAAMPVDLTVPVTRPKPAAPPEPASPQPVLPPP